MRFIKLFTSLLPNINIVIYKPQYIIPKIIWSMKTRPIEQLKLFSFLTGSGTVTKQDILNQLPVKILQTKYHYFKVNPSISHYSQHLKVKSCQGNTQMRKILNFNKLIKLFLFRRFSPNSSQLYEQKSLHPHFHRVN